MAGQDAYTVFKSTYRQAIADGFTAAVATTAAQEAMADVLRQNALQDAPSQVITSASPGRKDDPGPAAGDASDRGATLGLRDK